MKREEEDVLGRRRCCEQGMEIDVHKVRLGDLAVHEEPWGSCENAVFPFRGGCLLLVLGRPASD